MRTVRLGRGGASALFFFLLLLSPIALLLFGRLSRVAAMHDFQRRMDEASAFALCEAGAVSLTELQTGGGATLLLDGDTLDATREDGVTYGRCYTYRRTENGAVYVLQEDEIERAGTPLAAGGAALFFLSLLLYGIYLLSLELSLRLRALGQDEAAPDALYAVERRVRKQARTLQQVRENTRILLHELRAPLTVLCCIGETLSRHPARRRELLDTAREETARMTRLLQTYGQEAPQAQALRPERVNLGETVGQICKIYTEIAKGQKKKLSYCAPAHDVYVLATRDVLVEVLENLLENALFAGTCVQVSLCAKSGESTGFFSVFVRTEQAQIPRALQGTLFSRTASTKKNGGLGLWLCKDLLESIGGQIEFENVNSACIFEIKLKKAQF